MFLNGVLDEEVYMVQLDGVATPSTKHLVYQLHCVLYGLKQSPCACYFKMDSTLLQAGLIKSQADSNFYYHRITNLIIILILYKMILYVDDPFITGNDEQGVAQLKFQLMAQFRMIDSGPVQKYLGVKFERTTHGLLLHQTSNACNLLDEFHMVDCTLAHIFMHESTHFQHDTNTELVNGILYRGMVSKPH
jgi:hypothetical protein